ncbi:flagellar brake protein [Propionivibrio sp.]|uniref:flagellar brake protein n=1 Tax=Propionivibrio sp. TaxID=2212460 RepID=UPI003BF33361
MTHTAHYKPIRKADIDIGKPLPWSVYNGDKQLLLKRGFVLETQAQLDGLSEKGLYRFFRGGEVGVVSRPNSDDTGERAKSEQATERSVTLEDIKLIIGDPLQIQTQVEQSESRYYVKLIGYLKGKSVLVTAPQLEGNLCYIKEGQAFVVRFFSGKNAYAFTSSVTRVANVPYPHLHLSYPSQVRGLVVRSGDRVNARIICSVSIPEDTKTVAVPGLITNISVGGALLSSRKKLGDKNDQLVIKFRVFIRDIEFFITIDATICSVLHDDVGEILHGLRFAGLPNDMAIALTAYVYQKLAESNS